MTKNNVICACGSVHEFRRYLIPDGFYVAQDVYWGCPGARPIVERYGDVEVGDDFNDPAFLEPGYWDWFGDPLFEGKL